MTSIEYPKTENLFARDPETHKLVLGEFRMPEVALVNRWHVTEKIDGTNIRAIYFPGWGPRLEVRGRSDRATLPHGLEEYIRELLPLERLAAQFDEFMGDRAYSGAHVTIFGEGYGPGIQKGGGDYAPVKLFRAFDIAYHWPLGDGEFKTSWCQPETTETICEQLDLPSAPLLGRLTTDEVVSLVVNGSLWSEVARDDGDRPDVRPEGVVARTDPYLYTVRGSRVMFKLKGADLEGVHA